MEPWIVKGNIVSRGHCDKSRKRSRERRALSHGSTSGNVDYQVKQRNPGHALGRRRTSDSLANFNVEPNRVAGPGVPCMSSVYSRHRGSAPVACACSAHASCMCSMCRCRACACLLHAVPRAKTYREWNFGTDDVKDSALESKERDRVKPAAV